MAALAGLAFARTMLPALVGNAAKKGLQYLVPLAGKKLAQKLPAALLPAFFRNPASGLGNFLKDVGKESAITLGSGLATFGTKAAADAIYNSHLKSTNESTIGQQYYLSTLDYLARQYPPKQFSPYLLEYNNTTRHEREQVSRAKTVGDFYRLRMNQIKRETAQKRMESQRETNPGNFYIPSVKPKFAPVPEQHEATPTKLDKLKQALPAVLGVASGLAGLGLGAAAVSNMSKTGTNPLSQAVSAVGNIFGVGDGYGSAWHQTSSGALNPHLPSNRLASGVS